MMKNNNNVKDQLSTLFNEVEPSKEKSQLVGRLLTVEESHSVAGGAKFSKVLYKKNNP